jgi:superfamily II DNA/RNA helicase
MRGQRVAAHPLSPAPNRGVLLSIIPSFADLGVDADLVAALSRSGITEPFAIQALTIPDALAGRDICGKAKTGSGKTLAFGLPLLMRITRAPARAPHALVLVPTRELAGQVNDVLVPLGKAKGLRVGSVYGGTNLERDIKALRDGLDILIATPGRLIDLVQQNALGLDQLEAVVLDEADRMADMGFTPQVEWLLRHVPGHRQTLLFSATLDGDVDHLVRRYQTDPVRHEVESEQVTVEEMTHRFLQVHQMDKPKVAAAIGNAAARTLVFVRTKRGADRLVEQLRREGVKADAMHGDLRQQAREKALKAFTDGTLPVLVATDVAARGLHIEGVDTVLHYDPPEDHKGYLHRSGRTARAGQAGLVVTLVLWDQGNEIARLQRALGLAIPTVEMFSNDGRLADLAAWDPVENAVAS